MPNSRYYLEEQAPMPKKPQGKIPMGKKHKILAKIGSIGVATVLWAILKGHLNNEKENDISSMQLQASERGEPTIINTTKNTVSTRITEVITGKEEPESTVIINPAGQEPAIQVITPDATITASKTGEVETIIPKEDTKEKPLTETEAKQTVDTALKDAIEKTLPKEDILKPGGLSEEKK